MKIVPGKKIQLEYLNGHVVAFSQDVGTGELRMFLSRALRALGEDEIDADEEGHIHTMCPRFAEVDLQRLEELV